MSDEARAAAIEQRREERRAKRLQQAIDRVATFRDWLRKDAEVTRRRATGVIVPRPPMPEVPTDHDYTLVREQEDAS